MTTTAKTIAKILRVRKNLIKLQKCNKNVALCIKYTQEIELLMQVHGKKWNEEGWKNFAKRQISQIEYLIPGSKAGDTLKKELYEQLY
jgi:hypothetical protein